jgi:hypothetical protein
MLSSHKKGEDYAAGLTAIVVALKAVLSIHKEHQSTADPSDRICIGPMMYQQAADTTVSIDEPDPDCFGIRVTMSDNDDALQNAAQTCFLFGDNAMKELDKPEGNLVTTSFKAKVSAAPYEEANRGHITGNCVAHAERAFTKHMRKVGMQPGTELYKELRGDLGKLARFPLGYEQFKCALAFLYAK